MHSAKRPNIAPPKRGWHAYAGGTLPGPFWLPVVGPARVGVAHGCLSARMRACMRGRCCLCVSMAHIAPPSRSEACWCAHGLVAC